MRFAFVLFALAGCLEARSQFCGDKVCAPEARCDEPTGTCIPAGCGDGVVNNKEQCDGTALGDVVDCASVGFYDHSRVGCTIGCELDTSACMESCGDHRVNGPELCDGDAPSGQSCLDYGYGTGRIACANACTPSFDACTTIGLVLNAALPHSLHGIDGRSGEDGYAVGGTGAILHYDGRAWSRVALTSTAVFQAVWVDHSVGASAVIAVGNDGTGHAAVARFDGQAWSQTVLTSAGPLDAIWGRPGDLWAVGTQSDGTGYAIHSDGTTWGSPVSQAGLAPLFGISGDPATGHAVAVGGSKTTGMFDGTSWTWSTTPCSGCPGAGVSYSLQAVLGLGGGEYIAVGSSPQMLPAVAARSTDGGATWTALPQTVKQTTLTALSGIRDDVYVAGTVGTLLRFDGKAFHQLATGTIAQLGGVWRAAADDVRVTFTNGEIRGLQAATWADAGPIPAPVGTTTPSDQIRLQAVATSAMGETIVAGNPTTIWSTLDGKTWSDANGGVVPASKNLTGVWFASNGDAYVTVANQGNLAYRAQGGPMQLLQPFAVGTVSTAVFGVSPTQVYIAAHGAKMFRGAATGTWTPALVSSTMADLAGVWGSGPTDLYAVGDDALLAHSSDGMTWSPIVVPGLTVNLSGVWGTGPSDVFVVGAKGTIVHFDGAAWRFQHTGNEDLAGVFGVAVPDPAHPGTNRRATDVFAFGPDSMFHYDGVSWSPMSLPLLFGALAATTLSNSTRNDVLFVGTRGNAATLSRALGARESRCSDGWDDDRNGLVDCADPACRDDDACTVAGGACRITGTLGCAATAAGTTFTGAARIDTLPRTTKLTDGPEATYRFDASATGMVTLTLDTALPLELVVTATYPGTAACDLGAPLAARTGAGDLTFAAVAGMTYAIVLDEAAGSAGEFTLATDCE